MDSFTTKLVIGALAAIIVIMAAAVQNQEIASRRATTAYLWQTMGSIENVAANAAGHANDALAVAGHANDLAESAQALIYSHEANQRANTRTMATEAGCIGVLPTEPGTPFNISCVKTTS